MSHHATHHGARKKKQSVLRRLQKQSINTLMPNTYSRRMTRYAAYDYDSVTSRGADTEDLEKIKEQEREDKENLFLESLLTKIHDTTSKFLLVNTEHSSFPIVYVSDEFLSFWKYSRKQIFLKDGRLPMMVGESTGDEFVKDLDKCMSQEDGHHFKEYTLYKAGHKKTVSTIVSVLTLPKHSKARYVLVATEELSNADTFGVDLDPKAKGLMKYMSCRGNRVAADVNDENYVPPVIRYRDTIRKDFEKEKTSHLLVIHDNTPKLIWDWILLYSIIWNVFLIPLQMAFRRPCLAGIGDHQDTSCDPASGLRDVKGELFENEWILSIITDILFILDVVMNCITTYINNDGVVISEIPNIIKKYMKTWFFIDAVAAIPWEIIIIISGANDDSILHFLKAIALLRVFRILRKVSDYMSSGVASFIFMMAIFVIFAHFFACAWFAIGKSYIKNRDGWLYKFVEQAQSPTGKNMNNVSAPYKTFHVDKAHYDGGLERQELYLTCLYFSFTSLSTVGFGNAAPQASLEKIFSVLIMVFGALLYASIFGNVASIIHRLNIETSELHRRQTELFDFIYVHHFPESLSHRMEDYFYNYWFRTKGVDAHEIMAGWPKSLREDCYMYIHDLLLKRWPVLKSASIGCQRMLSEKLQRVIVCPGDTIYHAGDCVGEIYFIVRGHIKVIKNDRLIGVLTTGDIFGEDFWPTRTARKSKANVQALTYCEFEVLKHESLNEIMIEFPDYWDIWASKLKISYELSAKGKLFSEDTPAEFVRFVEDERTIATDDILHKIQEQCSVSNPKAYYHDLNAKRSKSKGLQKSSSDETSAGLDEASRKTLLETTKALNAIYKSLKS